MVTDAAPSPTRAPVLDLAVDRMGSGPPLVLLHPLGGSRHVWGPVTERLARERDVIAIDMPGFGASPVMPEGTLPDPAALAAAIGDFLDSIGVSEPHVAGNSLGGWVALELALAGRARTVTAIAPAGLWSRPLLPKRGVARAAARGLLPLAMGLAGTGGGRRLALLGTVAHPERVPATDARQIIRDYATAPGFMAANTAMRASHFTHLAEIGVPVTLGWCDKDRLVRRPRTLPSNVSERVLRGCGHLPMWDAPEQVAQLLLDGSARA